MDRYTNFLIALIFASICVLIVLISILIKKHHENKILKNYDLQTKIEDMVATIKQNKSTKVIKVKVTYEVYPHDGSTYGNVSFKNEFKTYIQIWHISLLNDTRIIKKHRKLHPSWGPVVTWQILEDEK